MLAAGCGARIPRTLSNPHEAAYLDTESTFLKAHMHNGQVYVLSDWSVQSPDNTVSGEGKLLGINREIEETGTFLVPIDSVAIFETNVRQASSSVAALTVMTGISLLMTTYCILNPKACFGSCPTFYVEGEKDSTLHAEGFSASVMPSLEAADIDAFYRVNPSGKDLEVRMTNEALETHVVRYADLLIARRSNGGRVFATAGGEFWQSRQVIPPSRCTGPEGECREQLAAFDGLERISLADSTYLATKETVEVDFDSVPDGRLGLVIASRQSLLGTYLFYQALAYMGTSVGTWIAGFERQEQQLTLVFDGVYRLLGGIEVQMQNGNGDWVSVEEVNETGPLATDVKLVLLPDLDETTQKIRLIQTRGHWRLDYVALAVLEKEVKPVRLRPATVRCNSVRNISAEESLLDSTKTLVAFPGDVHTLTYRLPDDFVEYELFLESRGYYLEWIRDEWLEEEDPRMLALMLFSPEEALRTLAPEFKRIEKEMEDLFWGSRYAH